MHKIIFFSRSSCLFCHNFANNSDNFGPMNAVDVSFQVPLEMRLVIAHGTVKVWHLATGNFLMQTQT